MENIKKLWDNLETQLKKTLPNHAKKELFEQGASEEEIQSLEEIVGALPADFRESLKIHNGQKGSKYILHDGHDAITLLSIEEIIENTKDLDNLKQEMDEEEDEGAPKVDGIPVFLFPTGDYTLLNLQTGELGFFSHEYSDGVGFKNFTHFLETTLERLISRRYYNDDGYLKPMIISNAWNLIENINGMKAMLNPIIDLYDLTKLLKKIEPQIVKIGTNQHFDHTYSIWHNGQNNNDLLFFDGTESYTYLSTDKIFSEFEIIYKDGKMLVPIFANPDSIIFIDILKDKYNSCNLYKKQKTSETPEIVDFDLIDILLRTYKKLLPERGMSEELQLIDLCKEGDFGKVKELVFKGVNVNKVNSIGETALYWAIKQKNKDIAKYLIDNGTDINMILKVEGRIAEPLIMIVLGEAFTLDTSKNEFNIEIAKIIIHHKDFNPNAKNDNGQTAISQTKESLELMKLLLEKGADVNIADSRNETMLFSFCESGKFEVVKLLVDNGADVNITKTDSTQPIHKAVKNMDNMKIVKLLIEKGADINAKDKYNDTPLLLALDSFKRDLALYLIEQGADVHAKNNYNRSALHFAADKGYLEVVEALVAKGVEINDKDNGGATPLFLATDRKREAVIEFLKSKEAV